MNKRKGIVIVTIFMLAVMLTGCGRSEIDTEARMEKAERLLNEKYGESFVVTEYLGDNIRYKTFNVEAYAEAYPTLRFDAIVDFEGDGMRDSYVARRVSARAAEAMENAISDMECGHFVCVTPLETESTMNDPNVSVEEYIEDHKKKDFMIYLYIDQNEAETGRIYDCMIKISETLDCTDGYIQLFLTGPDMMEEVKEYVDTHRAFYGSYKDMTKEDLVGSFRFEKGVMTDSEEYLEEKISSRESED